MRPLLSLVFVCVTFPLLQGCVPAVLVGGTAATVGPMFMDDRGFGQVLSDTEILARVKSKWMDEDQKIHEMVSINVREGRVMLTGHVDTAQRQIDAVRLAWDVNGVKEVIDETKLGEDSLANYANDAWITAKLKTDLLFDGDVASVNYNIKTVDGTIYLLGIAKHEMELQKVIQKSRKINGVKGVVSHMRMKSDMPMTETAAYKKAQKQFSSGIREGEPIQQKSQDYSSYEFPNPKVN